MKKLFFIMLCVVVFASLAAAQSYTEANGTPIYGVDILGAHQNNGRGCAGCHAPHSGSAGAGGNAGTNGAVTINADPYSGNNALFAQDLTPIYSQTFAFGNNGDYSETIPAGSVLNDGEEIRGIAMCLACHDGNVAKGGMMVGSSYEGRLGMLPANVYGPNVDKIPTLLGNEAAGGSNTAAKLGNYNNDHPVGVKANYGKLRLGTYFTTNIASDGTITMTPKGAMVNFASQYGYPAISGTAWGWGLANPEGNTVANNLYVTCTTCHNQHAMYVYKGGAATDFSNNPTKFAGQKIAGNTYPTYFFINAPYNPGSLAGDTTGKRASSATQFCRQCHMGEANEVFGIYSVTTAF